MTKNIYKKSLAVFLVYTLILSCFTFTTLANNDYSVTFDGEKIVLNTPVINLNGRLMYPFRDCLEAMGADVEWVDSTRTAVGTLNGNTIRFNIGSSAYTVNGVTMYLDDGVVPFIQDGRTYIPIRATAEGLGFEVGYDQVTRTASIITLEDSNNNVVTTEPTTPVQNIEYKTLDIDTYYTPRHDLLAEPFSVTLVEYENEIFVDIDKIIDIMAPNNYEVEITKTDDTYTYYVTNPNKVYKFFESVITLGNTTVDKTDITHPGPINSEDLYYDVNFILEPIEVDGKLMIPIKNLNNVIPVYISYYTNYNTLVFQSHPFINPNDDWSHTYGEYEFKPNNLYSAENKSFINNLTYQITNIDTYYLDINSNVAVPIDAKVVKVDDQIYISVQELANSLSENGLTTYDFGYDQKLSINTDLKQDNFREFWSTLFIGDTTLLRTNVVHYDQNAPDEYYSKTFEYPPIRIDDQFLVPINMIPHILPAKASNYHNHDIIILKRTDYIKTDSSLISSDVDNYSNLPNDIYGLVLDNSNNNTNNNNLDNNNNNNTTDNNNNLNNSNNITDNNNDSLTGNNNNSQDNVIDDSKYISVKNTKINLGETFDSVKSKLGTTDKVSNSIYGFDWYYYNTDDYVDFIMVGIDNGVVVGLYSNSKNFSTDTVSYGSGSVSNSFNEYYFTDENNGNRIYGVRLLATGYRSNSMSDNAYLDRYAKEIFYITNAFRVANGKNILLEDTDADTAAEKHSIDLAQNDYFSHFGLNGSTPADRYEDVSGAILGIDYYDWGENVSPGRLDAIQAIHGWVNSSGHRENMLSYYTHLGVGVGYDSSSTYDFYATQVFITK